MDYGIVHCYKTLFSSHFTAQMAQHLPLHDQPAWTAEANLNLSTSKRLVRIRVSYAERSPYRHRAHFDYYRILDGPEPRVANSFTAAPLYFRTFLPVYSGVSIGKMYGSIDSESFASGIEWQWKEKNCCRCDKRQWNGDGNAETNLQRKKGRWYR